MPELPVLLDAIAGFQEDGVVGEELPDEGDGFRRWPVLIEGALPTRGPLRILWMSYGLYGHIRLAGDPDPQP